MARLPAYLRELQMHVEEVARSYGLDFFETIFEILDYKSMMEVAAYGGFPQRYPHWKWGMEYDRLMKSHRYGLARIYEMVINNDPTYAYLLEGNSLVVQKMVMAHVYAHNDFFRNNFAFAATDRRAIDHMADHAVKVRRLMEKHGVTEVESFLDACLSLENLIDIHAPYIKRPPVDPEEDEGPTRIGEADVPRIKTRSYMDRYINPPDYIEEQKKRIQEQRKKRHRLPVTPTRDVLGFLLRYAPLAPWERTVLEVVRDEAYYFSPQAMTKIMNEGWATYWHSKMMTEKLLTDAEVVSYADTASKITFQAPGHLNPYKMGVELFRDIEERWNKGRFGREYEECEDMVRKAEWDRNLGLGMQKIFEVRRHYTDITFIDEFLTPEFVERKMFYTFDYSGSKKAYVISSREFQDVKERLLFQLTNLGHPVIEVVDANHRNRGELLLRHQHYGVDLEIPKAEATLQNLYRLWKRPIRIQTLYKGEPTELVYDGHAGTRRKL